MLSDLRKRAAGIVGVVGCSRSRLDFLRTICGLLQGDQEPVTAPGSPVDTEPHQTHADDETITASRSAYGDLRPLLGAAVPGPRLWFGLRKVRSCR